MTRWKRWHAILLVLDHQFPCRTECWSTRTIAPKEPKNNSIQCVKSKGGVESSQLNRLAGSLVCELSVDPSVSLYRSSSVFFLRCLHMTSHHIAGVTSCRSLFGKTDGKEVFLSLLLFSFNYYVILCTPHIGNHWIMFVCHFMIICIFIIFIGNFKKIYRYCPLVLSGLVHLFIVILIWCSLYLDSVHQFFTLLFEWNFIYWLTHSFLLFNNLKCLEIETTLA